MTPLQITANIELDPWVEAQTADARGKLLHVYPHKIGLLPDGTQEGRPAVALMGVSPDGTTVVMETTWALLRTAVRTMERLPVAQLDALNHPED